MKFWGQVAASDGTCVCPAGSYDSACRPYSLVGLLVGLIGGVLLLAIVIVLLAWRLGAGRRAGGADASAWLIPYEALDIPKATDVEVRVGQGGQACGCSAGRNRLTRALLGPPWQVVGRGAAGVVIRGKYRGTVVALKRLSVAAGKGLTDGKVGRSSGRQGRRRTLAGQGRTSSLSGIFGFTASGDAPGRSSGGRSQIAPASISEDDGQAAEDQGAGLHTIFDLEEEKVSLLFALFSTHARASWLPFARPPAPSRPLISRLCFVRPYTVFTRRPRASAAPSSARSPCLIPPRLQLAPLLAT